MNVYNKLACLSKQKSVKFLLPSWPARRLETQHNVPQHNGMNDKSRVVLLSLTYWYCYPECPGLARKDKSLLFECSHNLGLHLGVPTSPHLALTRLASPRLSSPRLASPLLSSPLLTSPRLSSPRLASPRLASPHLTSPHLTSPHLTSPHLT